MNNFLVRARTAVFFVAVMVLGIFWNVYSYAVLMSLVLMFCLYEYYTLLQNTREANKVSFLYMPMGIVFGLSLFLSSLFINNGNSYVFWYALFPVALFFYFFIELFAASFKPFTNISLNITGILYIALPLIVLNRLAFVTGEYEPRVVLGIIFLVWANDAAAYVAGSLIGRHKFFERISPNKTWEGAGGGLLGCLIVAFLEFKIFKVFPFIDWIMIAVLVWIFATAGDLIVSMFKRSLKVKDTGKFFPGHGGFLDRFDALLFVIPFIAFYIFLRH